MSRATGVLKFQLESDLQYAQALYAYGRPNAAHAAISYVQANVRDEFTQELRETQLWAEVTALKESTGSALDNAVEPLEPWGISDYAAEEREFVESAVSSSSIVS